MRRLWTWLLWAYAWLTAGQADYRTVRGGSRDRSLRGKDRIRSRRLT